MKRKSILDATHLGNQIHLYVTRLLPRESDAAKLGRCLHLARLHPTAARKLLAALREMAR